MSWDQAFTGEWDPVLLVVSNTAGAQVACLGLPAQGYLRVATATMLSLAKMSKWIFDGRVVSGVTRLWHLLCLSVM